MGSSPLEVRSAVRREQADQYVLISLIAFAATIILTRLFLELTGYPRIETGNLHIAHVIWGGLFLFTAALLPLIYANNWALFWSALFSGIGFGLFMDEVGKFITQTNDYFYPPAAPIIYGVVLLVAFVYLKVRNPRPLSPREELYQSFHQLEELLDNDLDPIEQSDLIERLQQIEAITDDENLRGLAGALAHYIQSDGIITRPQKISRWTLFFQRLNARIDRMLTQNRFRLLLIGGLGWSGVNSVIVLTNLVIFSTFALRGSQVTPFFNLADFPFINSPTWVLVRFGVQGVVGLFSVIAALLFVMRKDQLALIYATLSLTISLTVVDILVFYLDQFSAAIGATLELLLLLAVMIYRRRFMEIHALPAPTPSLALHPPVEELSQDSFQ